MPSAKRNMETTAYSGIEVRHYLNIVFLILLFLVGVKPTTSPLGLAFVSIIDFIL